MNPPTNDYDQMLRESIPHFLANYKKGCTDFSVFGSIFFRVVQKMTDPPLEITWFYSAVTFHSSVKSIFEDPLKKSVVLAVKDLFQLLVLLLGPCKSLKRVAALAPVVYELYYLVFDSLKEGLCLKREIEGLVEGIASYISQCCSNYSGEWEIGSGDLLGGFADLTRVWTVDRVGKGCEFGGNLRVFFPLVSSEICNGVNVGCEVGYLAGVVMVEVFLLRLYLKFGSMVSREELQKDMQNWAAQTIKGFQNPHFFDMLLRMLLEPSLPVITLLNSRDEVLLREVLYDVAILLDYSFLKPEMWTQLPGDYFKNFALTWLLVADNAIQFIRECCDHTRAISYIVDAFSKSCFPYQLIKWVTDQTGLEENINRPNISTPKALIRWLLALENRGIRIFDRNISKLHARAVICKSKIDHDISEARSDCRNPNGRVLFSIDKVDDDQEMVDWLEDAFVPTDCMRRKRKEGRPDEGETRFKLAKFNYDEDSVGEICLPHHDDNLNGGKEVRIQSMV
ncbi:uncharacterized protein LOC130756964 [Actinidia eriantha]|uniref:uncharacterized protein LOC130756964 n=1 Tax=Actinidia eriantha TaxID=165200 RepID=UPI002585E6BB|nr:uncharacterized protein LOC130756964 [Actinidia eriantha]